MIREFLFVFIILIVVAFAAFFITDNQEGSPSLSSIQPLAQVSKVLPTMQEDNSSIINTTTTLYAVGDIMLGRGVEYMVDKYGEGDFKFPFLKIANELQQADILFGNLEGPISENGERVGSIYSFQFKPEVANVLTWTGFDVLSLANNHMLDYQAVALQDTMQFLKEQGIMYVGAGTSSEEAFNIKIKQVNGVKIGFLAYQNLGPVAWQAGTNKIGMAWINKGSFLNIQKYIQEIREQVDILVVSLHAGAEYQEEPNSFQTGFAKVVIDAGADLVLGHHPHVAQPVERYKHGWIAYSLGNFIFDQGFSEETMQGLLLKVFINNQTKAIKKVIPTTVKMNQFFQPKLDNK